MWLFALALSAAGGPLVDAIEADVGNHSVAMPFGHLARTGPLHPAGGLAAEHVWAGGEVLTLAQQVRIGGVRQGFLGTSATLGTAVLARVTAPVGPVAELGLGLGALSTWPVRERLTWDEQQGSYRPGSHPAQLGLSFGFDLGLGFDLSRVSALPLTPMLRYRWFAQSPFLPGLPLGPQGIVSLGLRWTLGGKR